jgi:hypothetical protein
VTAEIVLMNPLAVAMAADSAVSVGDSKEYQSANKLFALGTTCPVGIMIYGAADFMGVPWELIIKEYRASRQDCAPLATVDQYADDFRLFIASNEKLVPSTVQASAARTELIQYFQHLYGEMTRSFADSGAVTEDEAQQLILDFFDAHTLFMETQQPLLTTGEGYLVAVENALDDTLTEAQATVFGADLPDWLAERLRRVAYLVLTHEFRLQGPSGIVIAGFGSDDMFPRSREFFPQFVVGGMLAYMAGRTNDIGPFASAAVIEPCAQTATVDTFITGMDPGLNQEIVESVKDVLTTFVATVNESVAAASGAFDTGALAALGAVHTKAAEDAASKFAEAIRLRSSATHINPMVNAVQVLPKDELASMAESLVNLTSLRLRFSQARETVGGPIDVAVISRGDGFVWIKRKHYFSPELNPHFFTRFRPE